MPMTSLIIYADNVEYLNQTIDDIIDKTYRWQFDQIIICDDNNLNYERPPNRQFTVLKTNRIGKAKAWNIAADLCERDNIIFIKSGTKVSNNWLTPILDKLNQNPNSLISPIIYQLNPQFWMSEEPKIMGYGWRWDLLLYNKLPDKNHQIASISSNCIAVKKEWFNNLGGFDDGMTLGCGEDLELSLRSWLFGGSVHIIQESSISTIKTNEIINYNNLARIIEAWLPNQVERFYEATNLSSTEVYPGKINNLINLQSKQTRSIEWFFENLQPELNKLYNYRNIAVGKNVAIIGTGPSIDYIDQRLIDRHDLIIGVDFSCLLYKCDYIITDTVHIILKLLETYQSDQLFIPTILNNLTSGRYDSAIDVVPEAILYEIGVIGAVSNTVFPPFYNFENPMISAIHLALFMNAKSISLYGYDNKIIDEKSHTSRIEYYNDGKIWDDSESTKKRFNFYEYGLNFLSKLALNYKIPITRITHL